MTKFLILVFLFIALELAENQYEVIAQSHPLSVQKRSVASSNPSLGPVNGISVTHPLQMIAYAYRRGLMKVAVPIEIEVVPLGTGIPYPEVAASHYPISGQVKPAQQPVVTNTPYNRNSYRQYGTPQFGPSYYLPSSPSYSPSSPRYYYPPTSYQKSYPAYNGYNSYNTYNGYYNGYNQQYRYPYYGMPPRRIDISHTKPWPQYRPSQQTNTTRNATQNWSGNNTAINISSLVNNVTHPPNASAPIAINPTNAPVSTQQTTLPETTAAAPSTTTTTITTTTTMTTTELPEPLPEVVPQTEAPVVQALQEDASYVQPIFVPPNLAPDGTILPNGMDVNGGYSDQINGVTN